VHARWNGAGVVADDDARVDQFMQMTNEHALGDVGNAASQFRRAHGAIL